MLVLIIGIIDFIIWGFDFKYDCDWFTWVWFATGIFCCVVGIIQMKKVGE